MVNLNQLSEEDDLAKDHIPFLSVINWLNKQLNELQSQPRGRPPVAGYYHPQTGSLPSNSGQRLGACLLWVMFGLLSRGSKFVFRAGEKLG